MNSSFNTLSEIRLLRIRWASCLLKSNIHTNQLSKAPEPLLANYGIGRIRLYEQDMNMMALFNSQERTLQEFIDMGYVHLNLNVLRNNHALTMVRIQDGF